MAYVATNPPVKTSQAGGGGFSTWIYNSADAHGTVEGAGYFTNAAQPAANALGMIVGDVVIVVKNAATFETTIHQVTAISAAGAATINAATLA